jgi:hypothetical protein
MAEKIRIQITDKADGEIANIETDIVSLPDHPDFKSEKFEGLIDALVAFFERNPNLDRIEVQVVGSRKAKLT